MNSNHGPVPHDFVFVILVALLFLSVGMSLLHLPAGLNNLIVLGVAFLMTGLVAAQYMGLKREGPLIGIIVAVPLALFALLVLLLLPDIAHVPLHFLGEH